MFLWTNVVVPLSICLLILFILGLIIMVFNIIESLIYTKFTEWKMRIEKKKTEKALKNMLFNSVLNNIDLNDVDIDVENK